jgi:methionine biosynthesis protein MetW
VVLGAALLTLELLLEELLRISNEIVVTCPNFGHWKPRLSLGLHGVMPVSGALPNLWYDTPNIHLCTVRDFETLCAERGMNITRRYVVNRAHRSNWGMRTFPNLLGEIALYQLRRDERP